MYGQGLVKLILNAILLNTNKKQYKIRNSTIRSPIIYIRQKHDYQFCLCDPLTSKFYRQENTFSGNFLIFFLIILGQNKQKMVVVMLVLIIRLAFFGCCRNFVLYLSRAKNFVCSKSSIKNRLFKIQCKVIIRILCS